LHFQKRKNCALGQTLFPNLTNRLIDVIFLNFPEGSRNTRRS